MDIFHSVSDWVLQNLPYDRADADVVSALKCKRSDELLVLYLNWLSRSIVRRPRKAMRSSPFNNNPLVVERSDVIDAIINDIEIGADLTKYLSKRTQVGFSVSAQKNKKDLGRIKYLDLLLNDWEIHHLHVSKIVEEGGFVIRDDPLLFVIFREEKAYLIDIGTHASFSDDHLVRVATQAWPDDRLFVELEGIRGSKGEAYSQNDRSKLRRAGLASFIQIGNRVFASPGGISTAGTSTRVSVNVNNILRNLRNFEDNFLKNPSSVISFLRNSGGYTGDDPKFAFVLVDNWYGVLETTSGISVAFGVLY